MSEDSAKTGGAAQVGLLGRGSGWRVSEYVCTAGPQDRAFEERHEVMTIAAVLDGSFHYHADAGRALLHPGSLLLGNCGTCYECGHAHSRGDRCISFGFSPEYFAEIATSVTGSSHYRFSTPTLPPLPNLWPWLVQIESRLEQLPLDELLPNLIETVLGALCGRVATVPRIRAREETRIRASLWHIQMHAQDPLNLEQLAGMAAMSKYHFLRCFQRTAGMTPHQYLLSVRMRRAARRLATSAEPVSTIAIDCGFGDLSTFNHQFRAAFGSSPRVFRSRERVAPGQVQLSVSQTDDQ